MTITDWLSSEQDLNTGRALYHKLWGELPPILQLTNPVDESLQREFLANAFVRKLCTEELTTEPNKPSSEPKGEVKIAARLERSLKANQDMVHTQHEDAEEQWWVKHRININDPRLDKAPFAVREARKQIRSILPNISHLHLRLVVSASRQDTTRTTKLRVGYLTRLHDLLKRRREYWAIIDEWARSEEGVTSVLADGMCATSAPYARGR